MSKIIFSKALDKKNHVFPFIEQLVTQDAELGVLIYQGFQDMEEAPEDTFPLGREQPYHVKRILHGKEVDIELVKQLSDPPISEMKVDYNNEYHRLIFFPYIYKKEQCYVFVFGFTKVIEKKDVSTNFYMAKAKQFYQFLRKTKREEEFFE